MPVFAWVGAGAAALVAALAIMLKGGMVERPARMPLAEAGGGSADGVGIPTLGEDEEDPFKRFPRDRSAAGEGPLPLQTETGELNGASWTSDNGGEPAVSYESAGDGGEGGFVVPWSPDYGGATPTGQQAGLQTAPQTQPVELQPGGLVGQQAYQQWATAPTPTPSGGGSRTVIAI